MDTKIRFTPYEIQACLFDRERTLALKEAIFAKVSKDDIVLEAGGGTGILSMFAIQAGAKHVYIIELSARFTTIIRDIAERNGFADKITVINGDATETDIPEKVDVYISELLCTGLFNEPQIQAYNNCSRFFKPYVKCIPEVVQLDLVLCDAKQDIYGIDIACDSYLADDIDHIERTEYDMYAKFHFYGNPVDPIINYKNVLDCSEGMVNSVKFRSSALLSDKNLIGRSKFLFNPELLFLSNEVDIDKNYPRIRYEIDYVAGCDTTEVSMEVM